MKGDEKNISVLFDEMGIEFRFSNLRNLASSNITYPQFLACVSQRILLKQYAAQTMDASNLLSPMSRTSEIFDKNKASFSSGINNLFLKPMTLSVINSQTSKNKITKEEQVKAAYEFVKWYDDRWFNRLKSDDFLNSLVSVFDGSKIQSIQEASDDWEILSELYSSVDENVVFDQFEIDSKVFINNPGNIEPKWFNDVLSNMMKFMKLSGDIDLSSLNGMIKDEDLIVPTTSSFMLSTLYGIEEIEGRKKIYNAPLDPYNMFYIFRGTSMSSLLKMNQMVFTMYNYFKILL
jgi:hypothetical protein